MIDACISLKENYKDWEHLFHIAKPGCFLIALSNHRTTCEIEDAGWEIRDSIILITSKKNYIFVMAMKPTEGTFVENARKWGVAGLNIDGCRIEYKSEKDKASATPQGICRSKPSGSLAAEPVAGRELERNEFERPELKGRFPSNLILMHNNCENKCNENCPVFRLDKQTGILKSGDNNVRKKDAIHSYHGGHTGNFAAGAPQVSYGDEGGASRFFYCAKDWKDFLNYIREMVSYPNERNILVIGDL